MAFCILIAVQFRNTILVIFACPAVPTTSPLPCRTIESSTSTSLEGDGCRSNHRHAYVHPSNVIVAGSTSVCLCLGRVGSQGCVYGCKDLVVRAVQLGVKVRRVEHEKAFKQDIGGTGQGEHVRSTLRCVSTGPPLLARSIDSPVSTDGQVFRPLWSR